MSLDQPFSGPSMMPNSNVASPTIDRIAPNGSSRVCLGSRDFGTTKAPRMSAVAPIGMFTQNTELHEKCSSNRPPVIGPTATASPETPCPDGDRPAPLARVAEDVGQDRQRRRHDQRATDAHERPGEDQLRRRVRKGGGRRSDPEQHDADLQRALAPEAIGQAAAREQQTGEHDHVGVDDPLDLAVAGAEVGDQRGDRHVEDRVVHHDDEQRHAERAEDQPAPFVDARVERVVVTADGRRRGVRVQGVVSECHSALSSGVLRSDHYNTEPHGIVFIPARARGFRPTCTSRGRRLDATASVGGMLGP